MSRSRSASERAATIRPSPAPVGGWPRRAAAALECVAYTTLPGGGQRLRGPCPVVAGTPDALATRRASRFTIDKQREAPHPTVTGAGRVRPAANDGRARATAQHGLR